MEWQLAEDGTWRPLDDGEELDAMLASMRAMTEKNRLHIAHARTLIERVRASLHRRVARRSWAPRSRRVH